MFLSWKLVIFIAASMIRVNAMIWARWSGSAGSARFQSTRPIEKVPKCDWLLRFDGGSRGNPGLGGAGAVIYVKEDGKEPQEVWHGYFFGGNPITNNQAEYKGLIEGLKQSKELKLQSLEVQGDSLLIIRQLQGIYRVRREHLIPLHFEAQRMLLRIPVKSYQHIPREENGRADELSNIAMDTQSSGGGFSNYALFESHMATIAATAPPKRTRRRTKVMAKVEPAAGVPVVVDVESCSPQELTISSTDSAHPVVVQSAGDKA